MPRPRLLTCLAAIACHVVDARVRYSNVIAQQAAYEQTDVTWFANLDTWHVPESAVPASPAVPSDAPARDMVFGDKSFSFTVFPVNPASSYQLECTFLDDGGDRKQSLAAGDVVISPSFTLPEKIIWTTSFDIPSTAVTSRDNVSALTFTFGQLAGPNPILSSFVLSSSNPADHPVSPPPGPPGPGHALPRLTPRAAAIDGVGATTTLDLNGEWQFNPAPSEPLLRALRTGSRVAAQAALAASPWVPIVVPGEYTLQGYRIAPFAPVVYQTQVTPPAAWGGLRSKLRFDGAYSNATVYVDGVLAGAHLGGFTPFEVDITAFVTPGVSANLTVVLVGDSLADTLAKGSQYATHDLGGLTRKVYLLAAPTVSIADVHVVTSFSDQTYASATLWLNISVANDGASAASAPSVVHAALSFAGAPVATGEVTFAAVPGATVAFASLNISVAQPALWDPEHPRLHDLTLTLTTAGSAGEAVALRVGFRDVVVAGNRVLVNGHMIKAHGTTRHEAHPLVGRSLWTLEPAGKQWERDIIAFRDANINYIRTSHYPPCEELMLAADELGMFIELEMPLVWASDNVGGAAFNYTVQVQREAMVFNRNHPSVIFYSLGNESPWNANFKNSLAGFLREIDESRPFMFDGGNGQTVPPLDLLTVHYPDFAAAESYANAVNPTLFGEYAHLNCYNRREIATDQGVRDIWGLGVEEMWEIVYAAEGVLGACYWAGMDDIFYMPGGEPVGYGEWGVIDAWRRPKPETFLVRNMYAPVKLQVPPPGSPASPLVVENRFDFTDLKEVAFAWRILESGAAGTGVASGAPRTSGLTLTLQGLPPAPLAGTMEINATSPRGFLVNSWLFPLQVAPVRAAAPVGAPPTATELPDGRLLIQDTAGAFSWFVSATGSVAGNTTAGGALLAGGPTLMVLPENNEGGTQLVEGAPPILPFNDPLTAWALQSRTFSTIGDAIVVVLTGRYAEASGSFTLAFDSAARLHATYAFDWAAADVTPRQVGLVWAAPAALASVSWRRTPQWATAYPQDHIGRPAGDGVPPNVGPVPGNVTRPWSWANDPSPLGDADFRSTRHNVTVFQLGVGDAALAFVANGAQHARAWVAADSTVGLLTADLSNEGANPFSRERVLPRPTYTKGAHLMGTSTLQLGSAL